MTKTVEISTFSSLLTVDDIATYCKISTRNVNRLIAAKKLAVVRFGRSVRITPEVLTAYLTQAART